ncbi:MAG: hypothetical protein J6P66_08370, partial [Bacteroidaceae bacterium]|nr:hypothetical protein [Bacteroidaceae bacterium]
TRPSIQFDAMSGTAGEVTARSTRFGTILSGRARQPGRVTPQQKDMRALFARVGRSFKRLTPAQIDAWSSFAQQYSFGSRMEAKSPAVNAYVTLNCNYCTFGLFIQSLISKKCLNYAYLFRVGCSKPVLIMPFKGCVCVNLLHLIVP